MTSRIAFADESGTDGRSKCYTIGVVSFEASCLDAFEQHFTSLLVRHGVQGEAKWTRLRTSHGLINFALDALNSILRSRTASFLGALRGPLGADWKNVRPGFWRNS